MITKRFGVSEVFVCEDTAKCAVSNVNENTWPTIESFIEQNNFIPKYVFALPDNHFAVKLADRYYLDLVTKDAHFVLMDFK